MSGVLDTIDALRGRRQKGSPVFMLTPLGKSKLEKPGVPDYQWRVMNCLNENGPCSGKDVIRETGMGEGKAKAVCRELEADGFIKRASTVG